MWRDGRQRVHKVARIAQPRNRSYGCCAENTRDDSEGAHVAIVEAIAELLLVSLELPSFFETLTPFVELRGGVEMLLEIEPKSLESVWSVSETSSLLL